MTKAKINKAPKKTLSKVDKRYKGVVIPAVTPLTARYRLDHEGVEKIFSNFYKHEVSPFILGTTGESASLSMSMKKEYVAAAGRLKKDGTTLYAGISSNCFEESVDLAKYCFDSGVDAVAATLPSYYAMTETQMQKYFEELADAIAGPLIIYNIPATTHMSIPLELIDTLSHHPNIVGTKDSERSEERLNLSVKLWKTRKDFSHFLGWAAMSAKALFAGSDGLVPSTGNLHPKLYADMLKKVRAGNEKAALELQKLSDELGDLYQAGRTLGSSLWALKVLMQKAGLCRSYMMAPLYAESKDQKGKLLEHFELLS